MLCLIGILICCTLTGVCSRETNVLFSDDNIVIFQYLHFPFLYFCYVEIIWNGHRNITFRFTRGTPIKYVFPSDMDTYNNMWGNALC